MILNGQSKIELLSEAGRPVARAAAALQRDMAHCFTVGEEHGAAIWLRAEKGFQAEGFSLRAEEGALAVCAGDDLGFVYGLYEISRRFLGVQPFWFWNDQHFAPVEQVIVADDFSFVSRPTAVRWRGWFLNDETLLSHWSWERRPEGPWEMAFEALLRLGGNLVVPGTDANTRKYRQLAADMGLVITHHHAEPLGAEMFARAYPGLEPSFARYPEQFYALWRQALADQKGMRVIWNIGFRGQGDRPFWQDDPQYDTPEKRGALVSRLMLEQYRLVKAENPAAVCCTNLYGETMALYRDGYLQLPEDVIKIWADNGFGKMVSRRQGNDNPRIPALPAAGDTGRHGLYYHVSFYDLQAASHITALPNSAAFVREELRRALQCGVKDYWLVNCSNIKPHTYLLGWVAALWQNGDADESAYRESYARAYYGAEQGSAVAACLQGYAEAAVSYGPHEDDHAGDQFYNHVPRMLISHYLRSTNAPCGDLRWLTDAPSFPAQVVEIAPRFARAAENYDRYLQQCRAVQATLPKPSRTLFEDTILLQAHLYALWAEGAQAVCRSLAAAFAVDDKEAFYQAGRAKQAYSDADAAMRSREHGKWIDFYANECQTDVKQSAQLCGYLMSYLRNRGEGPHFYQWQREFGDSAENRRVMLILNTENHPTDDILWRWMEQRYGD